MTDTFKSEAEFLRSTATDIETGEPLYDDARPDLYAIDARRIADRIEALEAENARLRVALMQMVGATVYLPHDGFSKPHEHESSRIARAVIEEISDD